jgi:hypothetical protein
MQNTYKFDVFTVDNSITWTVDYVNDIKQYVIIIVLMGF